MDSSHIDSLCPAHTSRDHLQATNGYIAAAYNIPCNGVRSPVIRFLLQGFFGTNSCNEFGHFDSPLFRLHAPQASPITKNPTNISD